MVSGRYGRGMTDVVLEPETTWDFSLSAADGLVLWHQKQEDAEALEVEARWVVVLIAAAVHALAVSVSLEGPRIMHLGLGGTAGVQGVLTHRSLTALRTCPDDARGADEARSLIASHGGPWFASVQRAADAVIDRHVRTAVDEGRTRPTILDRASLPALADEARSRQQYLTTDGIIWVVYDDTRLPIVCGRCYTNEGLRLRVDAEAGTVRIVCPDRHVTRDPRLGVGRVQEAIGLGGASRTGDVEITGAECLC